MNEFGIFIRGIYIDILSHLHLPSSLNSKLSANTNSSIGKAKLQNTGIKFKGSTALTSSHSLAPMNWKWAETSALSPHRLEKDFYF